jgi:hypothetical protein
MHSCEPNDEKQHVNHEQTISTTQKINKRSDDDDEQI